MKKSTFLKILAGAGAAIAGGAALKLVMDKDEEAIDYEECECDYEDEGADENIDESEEE